MNSELKAKWTSALKGGQYPQGQQQLKSASGAYCCLGVLAEVAGVELPQGEEMEDGEEGTFKVYAKFGETLSTEQALCSIAPILGLSPDVEQTLITLNDGDVKEGVPPHSFEKIAQWIETHNLRTGQPLSEGEPQE